MKLLSGKPLIDRVEQLARDHYVNQSINPDAWSELGIGRYLLLERGHYGAAWISDHPTRTAAGRYSLNQEYSEDWSAELLLDRVTGAVYYPRAIVWEAPSD